MANIDYPAGLPTPSRAGYSFQHVSPFARTEMATGRARQRRTFQSVPSLTELQFTMTQTQAQLFEAWFAYDINDGGDWFNIDLKTPLDESASYECRFTEMYSGPSLFGLDQWQFTAQVELRERAIFDESWYIDSGKYIRDTNIIDIAMNQLWPEA
jgi:hypothetical protein